MCLAGTGEYAKPDKSGPNSGHYKVSLHVMDCTLSLHSPLQEGTEGSNSQKKEGLDQGFGDEGIGTVQWYTISAMPAEKVLGICCSVCIRYCTTHGSLRAQTTSSLANHSADFDLSKMGSPEEGKQGV